MKKTLAIMTIAGLMLTASAALANDDGRQDNESGAAVKAQALFHANLEHGKKLGIFKHRKDEKHFAIFGTVTAVSSTGLTVQTKDGRTVSVTTDSETKFTINRDTQIQLADIKVGNAVAVKGEMKDNNVFEADHVAVVIMPQKAFGTVTAKTDTSVTVKNSLTGDVKTFVTNPDTEVKINGETKTTSDIQVGDRGWVKFKATLDTFVAKIINLFR
ncbi:MAG: hypothetical protein HYV13_04385 [Candidatus Doudnabacteria bacterium]|nr:hypothetical protein [Candidatus Doudnabacteria bacterium]